MSDKEHCEVCGAFWKTEMPEGVEVTENLCPLCWSQRWSIQQQARDEFGASEVRKIESAIFSDGFLKWFVLGTAGWRLLSLLLTRWTIYPVLLASCIDFFFLLHQFKLRKVVPMMIFSETTRMQMARVLFTVYAAFNWHVGLAFFGLEIFGMLVSFTVMRHDKDVS